MAAKKELRPYVVEIFDPEDQKTLCYFQEPGSWVRHPAHAKRFRTHDEALPDYSLIQMHFLYARIVDATKLLEKSLAKSL